MLSGGASAPKSKHLDGAELPPVRIAMVHARPTLGTPRLRLRLRSEWQESVALSGAIAESKGLEFAEHAPVRFATALDISPSRPLDCAFGFARNDRTIHNARLFCVCHVERRAAGPKSKHLDGAELPPVRIAMVHARPTVEIPRLCLRLRSEWQKKRRKAIFPPALLLSIDSSSERKTHRETIYNSYK